MSGSEKRNECTKGLAKYGQKEPCKELKMPTRSPPTPLANIYQHLRNI